MEFWGEAERLILISYLKIELYQLQVIPSQLVFTETEKKAVKLMGSQHPCSQI